MIASFVLRRRATFACVLGVASLSLLIAGLGLTKLLPLPEEAVADDQGRVLQKAPSALLPPEQSRLLQASVDSVALGISGALATMPDDETRRKALGAALDSLTFDLGGEVYFTAWQQTRLVHSPLSPDAATNDFGEALDERGASFVREMENVAAAGGGFMAVTLPRQLPKAKGVYRYQVRTDGEEATPLRMNPDAASITRAVEELSEAIIESSPVDTVSGTTSPSAIVLEGNMYASASPKKTLRRSEGPVSPAPELPGFAPSSVTVAPQQPPRPIFDSTPVEQVVYVREVPGTGWHVAAFLPGHEARQEGETQSKGFSEVLSNYGENDMQRSQERFRKGLCMSGLSLAGFAGLLLVPSGRGRRRESEPAEVVG